MKRYIENLGTAIVAGVLFLGMGTAVRAQQATSSRQQPMEIPVQYSQQQPYPGGPPQQQGPQQQPNGQQQDDPGAARVSFIRGDVSTQHSDSGDWAAATVNTPVVTGDHISTGKDSRAEIQLDHANVLRMADDSTANVVSLSPAQMQIQIGQGLVNYEVLKNSDSAVEIQTPNVAIHPQAGEGSFRILVNSDGETIVDVRKGSADVSTPQGSTRVERDQRITIQGTADSAQYQVSGAPGRDEWDKWNGDRDHTIDSAESWQHTNPYYTGSQDLDANGQWNNVPDYGSVWFPNQDQGWAPYRDGRWVFEPYYGWTWVSYEPWGWAPYHYGRWFVYGGNWGWWPGPVYGGYRPLWAPAYVSFLGFGGGGWGVNIGLGFGGYGSVGWLPIGPGDRFYPWYGRGANRVNAVNVYNIHNERGGFEPLRGGPRAYSNVDRAFNDDRVRGGITSMRGDQFGRARVPAQQQRIDAGSFRQASMIAGGNPVSPSRDSYRPSDRQVNPGAIPNRASNNLRFFSGNSRQGAASQTGRGQSGFNRAGSIEGAGPQQNSARPSMQGSSTASSQSGWRTFNSPSRASQPEMGGRNFSGPNGAQARPSYSQPSQSSRPPQSYSRGSSYGYESSRPPLNMQQPVVTPRGEGSYSGGRGAPASAPRNAPSYAPANGGYRGGPPSGASSGGNRGGYSGGGGSRGGSSSRSSGDHGSSGHGHR